MYNLYSRFKSPKCVVTQLFHLRHISSIGLHPKEVIKLDIVKEAHSYDIENLCNFTKLEKINMVTDEEEFIPELLKNINSFENLYELSIKLKLDKNKFEELIDKNCYDVANVLLIKTLRHCSLVHNKTKNDVNCEDCYACDRLQNTESANCVIQNIIDFSLLNSMSSNIKKLIVVNYNHKNIELLNLPFFLEKLIIVYKTLEKPNDFYNMYKSKIKVPYGCSLKIIQDYDVCGLDVESRHFNVC
jgi:hypothetical protein